MVARHWGCREGLAAEGNEGALGVMEVCCTLFTMVVTELYAFVKMHRTVH